MGLSNATRPPYLLHGREVPTARGWRHGIAMGLRRCGRSLPPGLDRVVSRGQLSLQILRLLRTLEDSRRAGWHQYEERSAQRPDSWRQTRAHQLSLRDTLLNTPAVEMTSHCYRSLSLIVSLQLAERLHPEIEAIIRASSAHRWHQLVANR